LSQGKEFTRYLLPNGILPSFWLQHFNNSTILHSTTSTVTASDGFRARATPLRFVLWHRQIWAKGMNSESSAITQAQGYLTAEQAKKIRRTTDETAKNINLL
jgi:hydroxyacyl-ACP dehydratase HTD2-like protein with hotdog domain